MSSEDSTNYEVETSRFAERHFVKVFRKKYKKAWDVTESAIIQSCARIDTLIGLTDRTKTIKCVNNGSIVKLYFRVARTNQSAKSSGNRAIIYVDKGNKKCLILLVYSKNEICSPNETQKWQGIVKNNFPEIWGLLKK